MSGVYILTATILSYFFCVAVIELYGRYLLRKDAKRRAKYLLELRSYDENNH